MPASKTSEMWYWWKACLFRLTALLSGSVRIGRLHEPGATLEGLFPLVWIGWGRRLGFTAVRPPGRPWGTHLPGLCCRGLTNAWRLAAHGLAVGPAGRQWGRRLRIQGSPWLHGRLDPGGPRRSPGSRTRPWAEGGRLWPHERSAVWSGWPDDYGGAGGAIFLDLPATINRARLSGRPARATSK